MSQSHGCHGDATYITLSERALLQSKGAFDCSHAVRGRSTSQGRRAHAELFKSLQTDPSRSLSTAQRGDSCEGTNPQY